MTPIEKHGPHWLKRDDYFTCNGIAGGKVRTCLHIATHTHMEGPGLLRSALPPARGLVTASARRSPQAQIVARVAASLGLPSECYVNKGDKNTPEMEDAIAHGANYHRHRSTWDNKAVEASKADFARIWARRGYRYVPFGMECQEAVTCTARAVPAHLPAGCRRILVPVGSGMSLAGILTGMAHHGHTVPVVGVCVGASPVKRLNRYAPRRWRDMVCLHDITADVPYGMHVDASIGDVVLDPHYEAKCVEFLEPGDLFWIIGIRPEVSDNETEP